MEIKKSWTISELSNECAVTPRTLRFYESKGILEPLRKGQKRIYNYKDRARLILVLRGKRLGLPLDEIKSLMDLYNPNDNEEQLQASLKKAHEQIVLLNEKKRDIELSLERIEEEIINLKALLQKKKEKQGKSQQEE